MSTAPTSEQGAKDRQRAVVFVEMTRRNWWVNLLVAVLLAGPLQRAEQHPLTTAQCWFWVMACVVATSLMIYSRCKITVDQSTGSLTIEKRGLRTMRRVLDLRRIRSASLSNSGGEAVDTVDFILDDGSTWSFSTETNFGARAMGVVVAAVEAASGHLGP